MPTKFGFGDINDTQKNYLKEAGLHTNAKFLTLSYDATEDYEFFDIEIETNDGRYFRERTFGPNIEKVYPRNKYSNGKAVGMENKQEAYDRVVSEINMKLYWLALCFVDKETLVAKAGATNSLKETVEAINKLIAKATIVPINFLAIWRNSEGRQKSNLIIAEKVKWCEPYVEGKSATIRLTPWQLQNCTIEKYPYKAEGDAPAGNAAFAGTPSEYAPAGDDLPF